MINRVILLGNLTRDVEMRYMPSGDGIASFGLATSRRWKDKNGERKEEAEFHNITIFGGLAKVCGEYLKKGSKVYVEGRIKTETWEKDGEKRSRVVIIGENMHMLDSKPSAEDSGGPCDPNTYRNKNNMPSNSGSSYDDIDQDIPFASLNWQIRRHLI